MNYYGKKHKNGIFSVSKILSIFFQFKIITNLPLFTNRYGVEKSFLECKCYRIKKTSSWNLFLLSPKLHNTVSVIET